MSSSHPSPGWRTARSRERLQARAGVLAPLAAPAAPPGMPYPTPGEAPLTGMPWTGVQWSLLIIGFLGYIWAMTTYSLPIGEASMAAALVGLLLERGGTIRVPAFLALFGAWVVWGALGYLGSPYPSAVMDTLDNLWRVWMIALVCVNVLRTRERFRFFLFFFLGAYALYPVRGTLFNYVGGYRTFGRALWNYTFSNPNDLAAVTLLMLSLCAAIYIREPKGWPKLAALSGLFMLPAVILLTQSRGAFIALAVFGLFLIAGQKRKARAIVAVVAVAAVAAMFAPSSLWVRIGGLANVTDTQNLQTVDKEGSAEQRFEIWKVAGKIIREHPVSGIGVGAYPAAHTQYATGSEFNPTARGARDTHSTYLNVLAETGAVGLVLFVMMLGAVLSLAERIRRRSHDLLPASSQQILFLEIGLVGYLMAGIFGSFAKISFLYIHMAILWAAVELTRRELGDQGRASR
jgi:probable O-glycosylation ligase (exosortase A-associated)